MPISLHSLFIQVRRSDDPCVAWPPCLSQTYETEPVTMVQTTPPVPDPGWISGACSDYRRPQYSPAVLVLDVRAALATAGVEIDPAPNHMHIASIAAADLLRALGVAPATAPVR